jgi:ribosomal protein L34E
MDDITQVAEIPTFEPLKVHCSDARCEANLHCFSPNRRKKGWKKDYTGQCQSCGKELVDWNRVRSRNLSDVKSTFDELSREYIRHVFFHAPFDDKSKAQARQIGLDELKARARPLLEKKIGKATIFRDGTQTKKEGSALHYAQHATATCCRKCLEYWHGIERGRELTAEELSYCEALVIAYLDSRAEELLAQTNTNSEGQKGPS